MTMRFLGLLSIFAIDIPCIAAGLWVPSRPPAATYKVEARITEESGLQGRVIISVRNSTARPLEVLAFDWAQNAFQSIKVQHKGQDLDPRPLMDGSSTAVTVKLPHAFLPGSSTVLQVEYNRQGLGTPLPGIVELKRWFPRLYWNGRKVAERFETKLRVPDGYVVSLPGRVDSATGFRVLDRSVHCGFFTARDHKVVERDIEGVKIRAFFPADGEQTAKACLETAVDVVRFYKKWLGFYPHPSLDILPGAPAPWGGYLFATAQSVIHGMPAFDTKPIEHWRWITAHEIGHQYWGAHVLDGDDPQWLWIGLGIYADFRWREHAKTDGAAPFFSTYLEGVKAGHDTTLDLPPQQARRLKFDRNNVVVHGKGWAVISALEAVMGRKTFEIAYRACLREFAHRPMGWRDFQKVCESACGQDLRWFFEEWVRTKNYAAYRIASQECVARGKGFHAVINVEKVGQIGLPLPVKALFEDGSSQIRVLDRMAKTDRWELESQAPLKEVKLDPEGRFAFLPEALPPTRDEIEVRLDSLPWKQAGIEAVEVFEAARRVRIDDAGSWFKLGLVLFEGGRFTESLQAFETVEGCKPDPGRRFGSLVWRGHLNDLKGRRDEALALYRQALAMEGDHAMQHSQLSITIDRAWVERRLKEPFRVDRSK